METTTLEEYKNVLRGRFNELSDEEKTIASDAADSPVGDVLTKVLGPELSDMSSDESMQQPTSVPEQMQRAGLGSR